MFNDRPLSSPAGVPLPLASPPPLHDVCLRLAAVAVDYRCGVALASIACPIAQTKAASSRATAVMATTSSLPARRSARKRAVSRVCAFQAISRTATGAASSFASLSAPTRAG